MYIYMYMCSYIYICLPKLEACTWYKKNSHAGVAIAG